MVLLTILVAVFAALFAVAVYRLVMLRKGGTPALLRRNWESDGRGWRHGLIRYGEDTLVFYKLSSLKLGADSRVARQGAAIGRRRGPRPNETDIMSDEIVVLQVTDGPRQFEVALDRGALTAFLSWIESRPSSRQIRNRPV